jgi:transcription initiation factor IIE alpha subunit
MTNELTEIIEHLENAKYIGASKAATMLRILDGQLAFRIDAVTRYQAKVEEQQAEIKALKAHLVKEPTDEVYFCSRCGKRLGDGIHTCTPPVGTKLYTHPVKEQYKFGVDWSKDGNAVTVLKICEDGVAEVVFMDYQEVTHPVKELTDENYKEALACLKFALDDTMDYLTLNNLGGENNHWLVWARAILRKAKEK